LARLTRRDAVAILGVHAAALNALRRRGLAEGDLGARGPGIPPAGRARVTRGAASR